MLKTSFHSRGVSSSHMQLSPWINMQSIMGSAWSLMIPAQHLPASASAWLLRIRPNRSHLHSAGSGFRFKAIMKC